MPRIEKRDLIQGFGQATPEQIILINWLYANFDYSTAGSGLNRHIANVEEFFYDGVIAGSEFLTYAATKLYLCFSLFASGTHTGANALYFSTYDAANALKGYLNANTGVYDTTTPGNEYLCLNWQWENFYFSRLTVVTLTYMRFIGYRFTLD